ncbi:ISL3 family transposase [Oscillochloris sp. ZM17-4]|uniref:ISL3 family transposase n=1 Tax=Oscillochloris sp. ZM17-4 TaxID=2866714 RepID=UPI001C7357E3|nr:ISL3 family transposase [Oscillochloris sp. ZM17-4]MBX0330183.1 ISL3 family transposase [Oscillochloris sp. ZM17-4]
MLESAMEQLLDLPHVRVTKVEQTTDGSYRITIESTLPSTTCRKCGRRITTPHASDDWVTLPHLPILGHRVFLQLRPKRFRCFFCADTPTTTQALSWYRPRSPFTKALEENLLRQCVHQTLVDVCLRAGVPYDAREGVLDHYLTTTVDWASFARLDTLGIDELALRKGHRAFVVLITSRQPDGQVRVITVLPNRERITVEPFLKHIPYRLQRTVTAACSDMYEGFLGAIEAVFGADVIVIDRFHVARHYRDAADDVRKSEMKRLKKAHSKTVYGLLKGAHWLFRKRHSELTRAEADVLACVFAAAPSVKQAYDLRNALTAIFDAPLTKEEATRQLQAWMQRVQESGMDAFDRFLAMLTTHLDGITNYFHHRANSGFVEGINTKARVLTRRCYGIFNLRHFFQRLTLDVEGAAAVTRCMAPH